MNELDWPPLKKKKNQKKSFEIDWNTWTIISDHHAWWYENNDDNLGKKYEWFRYFFSFAQNKLNFEITTV